MKILLINSVCQSGSTGKIAYDLCALSRADGHQAVVCYGRGRALQDPCAFKFGLDWETYLHAALTRLTGWTGCFSYFSTKRLLKFVEEFEPDVVHIHELHAYFVNLKPLLQYLAAHHIPVVQTLHCEFTYTGKCGYAYECLHWKDACGRCPNLKDYPKSLCFDHTTAMLQAKKELFGALENLVVVAPSHWLADRARQSFLSGCDIQTIPNGIDAENIFYPQEFGHLKQRHGLTDEKVVLAVAAGLMTRRKGGQWVIALAQRLLNRNIKVMMIGVDSLDVQVPANVILIGRTENQRELAAYYSMADCFVICSEQENFPTTCLEAFCCGTPVAGFDVGGIAETVPAPYGAFVPYGDIDALQQAVLTLLKQQFSEPVCKKAQELYSKNTMYRRYEERYQALSARREAANPD